MRVSVATMAIADMTIMSLVLNLVVVIIFVALLNWLEASHRECELVSTWTSNWLHGKCYLLYLWLSWLCMPETASRISILWTIRRKWERSRPMEYSHIC